MGEGREYEARGVDLAVFKAAQEMGRAPEDLVYEVLERGPERVRIRVEAGAGDSPAPPGARPPVHSSPASRPGERSGPPRRGGGDSGRGRHERGHDRGHERGPERERDSDEANAGWSGTPLYPDLRTMVEALVRASGLDLSVDVETEGETERVRIDGPDSELLLGDDAEALAALEHLLSKMALRGVGKRVRLRVDSAGYRRRREEELVQMALRSAERIKQEGGEFSTSPLNPYERRLVHIALKDDPAVHTHSEGDGFLKRVTIRPSAPGKS